ncbi:glutamate--tRNA ligase [Lysinibacillus sp. 2017]|uniref:glutamate--tRNA ligase n=1 Tax=unclassified Lysinibacillus TaxID=2636778 RepID=UPI000D526CD6|nr:MULTISPECIES: glutamate--tRNA ligase [unclassified Lysinibacillus]AWE09114.1 glutamate--tRNA ligase [Lysinibacillus sp. 2017]TGN35938.1 glutamate--tRNA ligase [Lysinibacillus sp. S2017]
MTKPVRVRYAPSPTGFLHIGGARTALFNYLYAKHHNGTFVVRIEDTDIERNVEGGEASQLDNLRWLGIIPDESIDIGGPYAPYRQMERLDIYKEHAEKMLEQGHAYKCFCSSEELEASREAQKARGVAAPTYDGKCRHLTAEEVAEKEAAGIPHTIRMRVPENVTYSFTDLVRGDVSFESKDVGDWVLVKANGIPTYNYAVVLDDHFMEMTHVFRGEEHLSNTPKQMMVFDAFGWEYPRFGHMTLIVNEDRKKLSKRDESIIQFVAQYKDLGYLPEAMFNFFGLLGWSPEGEEEIFSHDEFVKLFDEKRLSKSPSMFDKTKLTWMNNQYIKKLSPEDVVALALPHLQKAGLLPAELTAEQHAWVSELISLFHEQMSFGAEIVELTAQFFNDEVSYDEEAKEVLAGETVPQVMAAFKVQLENLESFDAASIKAAIKAVQKETGVKGKNLFMPIRVAIMGEMHGPELPNSISLIGKAKAIARVEQFAN